MNRAKPSSPKRRSATPRKRDKEQSKRRLLEAALELFSKHGYDAATTRMVSTRAGLNEQLITRYFGGKAGLLLAILEQFVEDEEQGKVYPPPADNTMEEVRNFLFFRHRRLTEVREFMKVFIPRMIVDPVIRNTVQGTLLKRETRLLSQRLETLRSRGQIRKDVDLEKVAMAIIGHSFFASFLLPVTAKVDEAYILEVIQGFADCMACGLKGNR